MTGTDWTNNTDTDKWTSGNGQGQSFTRCKIIQDFDLKVVSNTTNCSISGYSQLRDPLFFSKSRLYWNLFWIIFCQEEKREEKKTNKKSRVYWEKIQPKSSIESGKIKNFSSKSRVKLEI